MASLLAPDWKWLDDRALRDRIEWVEKTLDHVRQKRRFRYKKAVIRRLEQRLEQLQREEDRRIREAHS